jgi:hypothetical protein
MGGLPGLDCYAHYKEDSLYGGSLYRGNTVLSSNTYHLLFVCTSLQEAN